MLLIMNTAIHRPIRYSIHFALADLDGNEKSLTYNEIDFKPKIGESHYPICNQRVLGFYSHRQLTQHDVLR